MKHVDAAGHALSGANAEGVAHFDTAAQQLRCYVGDPLASVDAALAAAPQMVMAHAMKGYLHLLGTEPAGLPVARECFSAAAGLPADERERGHLEAVRLLAEGRWRAAGRVLEDVAIAWPRDALALQVGHQIDFFRGDSRMLRDRIARALPAWSRSMPGYHALLGMHAFGLEETGDYAQAEAAGRAAVELERRDTWAWHAVAHVHEMRNRPADGIAWMTADSQAWSEDSFFAVHNWWHLALYHLETGAVDEVLRLFDGPIFGRRSNVVLDMIDASAMLWRLHLRGLDVRGRFAELADLWAPIAAAGNYAFNDMHAMMALVGSGREQEQQAVLEAQRAAMAGDADNAGFTRDVGHAAASAIRAFGQGRYAECVELLRPIRSGAARFGGSHAQRDVIDLTLIEAAYRGGDAPLAAALAAERAALRPASPLARLLVQRSAGLRQAA
ncbi:MAG: tetratricopeptide repeat protein [Burkholderiales bacterium]|jgi:tetratricopeptide (TPR) repeat protein|nr:tetratricopeptide repeat protein [Burkholderiales bacterium]